MAENAERVFDRTSRLLLRRGYDYSHSTRTAKKCARFFGQKLRERPADFIFAPVAATEVAYLDCGIPIVYSSDATLETVLDYYPNYSHLFGFSIREAHSIEKLAIRKASLLLFPSQFAAESAVRDCQADESKVHVIPFGANLEEVPSPQDAIRDRRSSKCRLLFVGVDWTRKGGDIALEALACLRAMGVAAELTICGCSPPTEVHAGGVQVIPFLDKKDPAQRRKLADLYLTSDIFFLPTRAELYGIVFCEANAFGLPVITTDTGGVGGAVVNGQNGFMLPISARGPEYANLICEVWLDAKRYSELARSSRKAFDDRLNWDSWAVAVRKLLPQIL